jgi:hypothetical protein
MKKVDFYGTIHKAVRRRLFLVSMQIGTTDFTDSRGVAELATALRSLIEFLRRHAGHENAHVNPLIERVAPQVDFATEHEEQEAALDNLEQEFAEIERSDEKLEKGAAFYYRFNAFISRYLEHLNEEESMMPVLWAHYTQAELGAVFLALVTSITPAEMQDSMPFLLPSLNPQERAAFAA